MPAGKNSSAKPSLAHCATPPISSTGLKHCMATRISCAILEGRFVNGVDPEDPQDPLLKSLAESCLMVWIKGSEDHTAELVRRFDKAPKPMAYQPEFLMTCWAEYLRENNLQEADVDPDDFIRWTYARALNHRQPRYAAMAENWGITVEAEDMATVRDQADFIDVVGKGLEVKA